MLTKETLGNFFEGLAIRKTTFDGIGYECPNENQLGRMTHRLIRKINSSGEKFDRVVTLARGGLTFTEPVMDGLEIKEVSMVRFRSYTGVNQSGEIEEKQPLVDSVDGENVLTLDDVNDRGKTLKYAVQYILDKGGKLVKTATIYQKPWTEYKSDYWVRETKRWIVFPHERQEFMRETAVLWAEKNVSNRRIKSRFVRMGIPRQQVSYFMSESGFEIK